VIECLSVTTTDEPLPKGTDENPEDLPLKLLTDLQKELQAALKSLAGKKPNAITDRYYLNAGGFTNRVADGYLLLRNAGRMDASKLLIRPALEMMIRVQALRQQPGLFYRIGYTESEDDKKWFAPAARRLGKTFDIKADPPGWDKFEKAFKKAFPKAKLQRVPLALPEAARIAGLLGYYDTHYRMYCKHTHAALRATGGYLDQMSDPEDTRTMVNCTFSALDAVAAIGGSVPKLKSLRARCDKLSRQRQIKMAREVVE
jgi:hypothetical protein